MATSAQPRASRTTSSKRKLDELEIGVAESSSCSDSHLQVPASPEVCDEVLEGSMTEWSEKKHHERGICASTEAQPLDGNPELQEDGNEAVDTNSIWEEESGFNKLVGEGQSSTKVLTDDKLEDVVVGVITDGTTKEAGSSIRISTFISSQVDSVGSSAGTLQATSLVGGTSGGLLPSPPFAEVLSFGGDSLVSSNVRSPGRSGITAEESPAGKDGKSTKEIELDWLQARDRDNRDSSVSEHEEEKISPHSATLEHVGRSNLSGHVSSIGGGGNANGDVEASSSLPRPMVVETVNPSRVQFFVRTITERRRIVVIRANRSDSIASVHQQILLKTGLPVSEQRLIFGGRQLKHDQTIESCNVVNDVTMNLVARMRSTNLYSWKLVKYLVVIIRRLCAVEHSQAYRGNLLHSQNAVRALVQTFLKMASKSSSQHMASKSVSKHMQLFQSAGATTAIVMLLLSQVGSNRECAEEVITYFITANDEYLSAHIHCHCASVLLDFCNLLSKSAPNHSLYSSCRNALARLLHYVGIADGSPYFSKANAASIVHDFSPLVDELSLHLSVHLQWIGKIYARMAATMSFTYYLKEAEDFTAFIIFFCKAMEVCKGMGLSGSTNASRHNDGPKLRYTKNVRVLRSIGFVGVPLITNGSSASNQNSGHVETTASSSRGMGIEIGTHEWLWTLFLELLEEIDTCLKVVDEEAHKCNLGQSKVNLEDIERPLRWAPFLVILKGLHAIAKFHNSAMDDLLSVLGKRSTAFNMLIRQLPRWQDDDLWFLEHKRLLDFNSKRRLAMAMLPKPHDDDHDELQGIVVPRSYLLIESFKALAYVQPFRLQAGIAVKFLQEEATGPGVLREWFSMICREIFNRHNAFFLPCPQDRRRFFPNPASDLIPGHLTFFRFCGRVIALALMHNVQVGVVFAVTFFKQLAGLPISWEDAKDADPVLYESCKKILEMDPEAIDSDALQGLTFVTEVEERGRRKILELCQGGSEMVVNSKNRQRFVKLLVHRRLVASVSDQMKSFSRGFSDLLVNAAPQQFLRALDPEDLDMLLHGKDNNICLDDWKRHTEYHDYMVTDDQIIWFWQVAETMTPEQQRRLLFFSTSVTHLPAEGFAGLSSKFQIHKSHTHTSWLPTAHTCFNQLLLPPYPTYEIMYARLYAIAEVHTAQGFGFE